MSDDRLFASNNPIGRKAYIINLITLAVIAIATYWIFSNYIFPFVTDEAYIIISKCINIFLYTVYLITLFALVDRRLYDICGTRDSLIYKNISGFFTLTIIIQGIALLHEFNFIKSAIPKDILYTTGDFAFFVFLFILFIICFFKGKFSNLTYNEYKKKTKYE